jgi:hypothetical protein
MLPKDSSYIVWVTQGFKSLLYYTDCLYLTFSAVYRGDPRDMHGPPAHREHQLNRVPAARQQQGLRRQPSTSAGDQVILSDEQGSRRQPSTSAGDQVILSDDPDIFIWERSQPHSPMDVDGDGPHTDNRDNLNGRSNPPKKPCK